MGWGEALLPYNSTSSPVESPSTALLPHHPSLGNLPFLLDKTPGQSGSSHTSFHQGMMQPPRAEDTRVPS